MKTTDPDYPFKRNPLKFGDVAKACAIRWCVSEKSALHYLQLQFSDPKEALDELRPALNEQRAPDSFWESL